MFPYLSYESSAPRKSSSLIYRPEVTLRVVGPAKIKTVLALCDTGADHTILPLSMAEFLEIKMDEESRYHIQSLTGHKVRVVTGTVALELHDEHYWVRWTTEVGFIPFKHSHDEITVLGHIGCLDFFTATFDGKKHELTLKPNSRLPKR